MSSFFSPYRHQFLRLGACVPPVAIGEPRRNADHILALLAAGTEARVGLMVFPELGLSAYAIDDLLFQDALLDAVEREIGRLIAASRELFPVFVVGAPLRSAGQLYNCGLVIHRGRLLGVVPKVYLPNYREFYERRHFTSGEGVALRSIVVAGHEAPFGSDLLFAAGGCRGLHLSCRDLRGFVGAAAAEHGGRLGRRRNPAQPVGQQHHDRQGADAAPVVRFAIGALHRRLCLFRGGRAASSTTDLAWDGQAGIFEIGRGARRNRALFGRARDRDRRRRSRPHPAGADAHQHLWRLRARRPRSASVPHGFVRRSPRRPSASSCAAMSSAFPYVPSDPAMLRENCYEAYNIQVQGLAQRLEATGCKKLVIGVSGGLDSTQALIVSARVMDRLGLPRSNILAYTLPGFATSEATKANAWRLMQGARRHRRGDRHPPGGAPDAAGYRPRARRRGEPRITT